MVDAQSATTNWIWEAAIMHYGANHNVQVGGLYNTRSGEATEAQK